MSEPFIFIGTHRVKPGKLEDFKEYFTEFTANIVSPQEPRLLSFHGYSSPGSNLVTVVQVHPDAASMLTHMAVGREHFARAYADYLEPDSTVQIYGTPTPELKELIGGTLQSDDGEEPVTIREPFTGFQRLPAL